MEAITTLILAGGRGTRMASSRGALLHEICGVPMILLTCSAALDAGLGNPVVVVGHGEEEIGRILQDHVSRVVHQREPLGTGNAVLAAREILSKSGGSVLVLPGNLARITGSALRTLAGAHAASAAATTLLSAPFADRAAGRWVVRPEDLQMALLSPEAESKADPKILGELGSTCGCFRIPELLDSLESLTGGDTLMPCTLGDVVRDQLGKRLQVEVLIHEKPGELRGVATRSDLAEASASIRHERNRQLMASGVTFVDPDRTYVELNVVVERDVVLYPGVVLEGRTRIGEGSVVRSSSRITNSIIGRNVEVLESCVISESEVARGTTVGPFARLRDHSVVGEQCRVGNFVELKKTSLGAETKAAHLAYLGDAKVGAGVNIGAGVITCNYDGIRKSVTVIEDGAFVGTDSQLVAPVTVGRGAYVAAGSCITQDVPPGSLAIARCRQTVKEGWAERRQERMQKR